MANYCNNNEMNSCEVPKQIVLSYWCLFLNLVSTKLLKSFIKELYALTIFSLTEMNFWSLTSAFLNNMTITRCAQIFEGKTCSMIPKDGLCSKLLEWPSQNLHIKHLWFLPKYLELEHPSTTLVTWFFQWIPFRQNFPNIRSALSRLAYLWTIWAKVS